MAGRKRDAIEDFLKRSILNIYSKVEKVSHDARRNVARKISKFFRDREKKKNYVSPLRRYFDSDNSLASPLSEEERKRIFSDKPEDIELEETEVADGFQGAISGTDEKPERFITTELISVEDLARKIGEDVSNVKAKFQVLGVIVSNDSILDRNVLETILKLYDYNLVWVSENNLTWETGLHAKPEETEPEEIEPEEIEPEEIEPEEIEPEEIEPEEIEPEEIEPEEIEPEETEPEEIEFPPDGSQERSIKTGLISVGDLARKIGEDASNVRARFEDISLIVSNNSILDRNVLEKILKLYDYNLIWTGDTEETEPEEVESEEVESEEVESEEVESEEVESEEEVESKPIELFIGFDLGTSSSKVVIGDSVSGKRYPVEFRPNEEGIEKYFQPTTYMESTEGCMLVDEGLGNRTNFKMRLIDEGLIENKPISKDLKIQLSVYAGLVLRKVMEWFESQNDLQEKYNEYEIFWNLIVGFPDKKVQGNLEKAYRNCIKVAYVMARGDEPINESLALSYLNDKSLLESKSESLKMGELDLWPEIAAQLTGYIKSPYEVSGNLVLIDIGAGTVDLSTLILHGTSARQKISFHYCSVEPLGAYYLYKKRYESLKWFSESLAVDGIDNHNPMDPVPDNVMDFYSEDITPNQNALDKDSDVLNSHQEKCVKMALAQLVPFRKAQRDAHENRGYDPWKDGLPLILSGGGSRLQTFVDCFTLKLRNELDSYTRWDEDGLDVRRMPVPREWESHEDIDIFRDNFDRLSVAHGLAYGAENLPIYNF